MRSCVTLYCLNEISWRILISSSQFESLHELPPPTSPPFFSPTFTLPLDRRPSTPDLTANITDTPDDALPTLYSAVSLLQRLMRGRAEQNRMFEGRAKRKDLIAGAQLLPFVLIREAVFHCYIILNL